jgi:aminoacrylate hydrolase
MAETKLQRPDGAALAVRIDGAGPDLLLITGLSGTAGFWEPLIPAISKTFRVTRFDQRGVAASTRGHLETSVSVLADDAFAVMDHVGAKRPMILGHSMGGVILQSMALDHPARMAGAILSGTWARPNAYMAELFRARGEILKAAPREYAAMLAFLAYPPDWLDQRWPFYRTMLDNAPKPGPALEVMMERIAALLAFDRSTELSNLATPIAVQGAEDDLIVPGYLQRELAGLIPGATLTMLPNGGHFFPVSRPEAFLKTINEQARRFGVL